MKVVQPLSFVLIASWVYHGNGFQLLVGQRIERMMKRSTQKSLRLEKLQRMQASSQNNACDRHVATRRTWCRNVMITVSTVATTGPSVGQRTTAMETPSAAAAGTEKEDPLVTFGESLSSRKSMGEISPALPISSSSSSWPDASSMVRPTRTDPIVIPSTSQEVESSQQSSALQQVLQQSKLKKQINPTTHG